MRIRNFSVLFIIILLQALSCEQNEKNPELEDFCNVKPDGWDCEIIQSDFNLTDYPRNAEIPMAIIKYINLNREFSRYDDKKTNPSLTLDLYSIEEKEDMEDFVNSQRLYSWCIPIYFGETEEYFITTSPCFINGGSFTEEADSCIADLYKALEGILIKINRDLTEE